MNDNSVTPDPKSRRDMWLSIALAVAKDGMPEPELRFSHAGRTYLYLCLDRHDDARRWAARYGVTTGYSERPDLGTCYVDGLAVVDGWRLHIQGVESLPQPADSELAAQVAAAILTPDAELATAGGAA